MWPLFRNSTVQKLTGTLLACTCTCSTSKSSSDSQQENDRSNLGINEKRSIFDPVLTEILRHFFPFGVEICIVVSLPSCRSIYMNINSSMQVTVERILIVQFNDCILVQSDQIEQSRYLYPVHSSYFANQTIVSSRKTRSL